MKIAIVDGNNLSFKAYSVMKESRSGLLRNSLGEPTTVIFGLLRSLDKLVIRTKFDRVIITWDIGGGNQYRRNIYKDYKGNRDYKDMSDYFEELDACRNYMKVLGFNQAKVKGIEADDLIAWMAHKLRDENKVVIISDDKDFFQTVKKGIKVYRPIKDEFINPTWVEDEFGVKPKYFSLLQAFTGDKVDNIPGIKGIGPVTASKLIDEYGTTVNMIVKNCDHKRWADEIKKSRKKLKIYHRLTKLRDKDEHYTDEELTLLNKCLKKAATQKKRKVKKINMIRDNLEIKSVNLVYILRRIGILVEGYIKPPKNDVII